MVSELAHAELLSFDPEIAGLCGFSAVQRSGSGRKDFDPQGDE